MEFNLKFNRHYVNSVMKSRELKDLVFEEAKDIADAATQKSGYKYKAAKSKAPNRASAAAFPDEYGAVVSEHKHHHLLDIMNSKTDN